MYTATDAPAWEKKLTPPVRLPHQACYYENFHLAFGGRVVLLPWIPARSPHRMLAGRDKYLTRCTFGRRKDRTRGPWTGTWKPRLQPLLAQLA